MRLGRRKAAVSAAALAALAAGPSGAQAPRPGGTPMAPDLILVNGRFTTLDPANPNPEAVAIADGSFVAVGSEREVRALAAASTQILDLGGRRVIPGLNDSHTHLIRGG